MACTSYSNLVLKGGLGKLCFSSTQERKPSQRILFFGSFSGRTKTLLSIRSSSIAHSIEVVNDEEIEKIKRLQNGSDVRGVALEGEKGRPVDLTPPAVEAIAESFGEWLVEKVEKEQGEDMKVSLGRDPRISGPVLSAAVFAGLSKAGCVVFDMGLATTPACFMSTILPSFDYDASHLPYTRNGLKFFTKRGGLTSPEVEELCDRAARKYANRQAKVSLGLRGFFTYDVLDKLGADTFGSLHLNPDGMFPNHIPNPEDKIAMSLTRTAVLENDADIGIVFDTDVDRSGVVDNKGNPINGDKLIALMSSIVLKEHPGSTIVTDARTSIALSRFIARRGGRHCLYRVGYRNVIDKGVRLNEDGIETHLMMETSGHGALKENYFLDDGAYMTVKIIIEMVRMRLAGESQGIGSLIDELEEPLESVELRMNVIAEPRYAKAKAVETIDTFRRYVEDERIKGWELDSCGDCWIGEGCLVDLNDSPTPVDAYMYRVKVRDEEHGEHGWIHLRQSVHNPNIAVNMQSSIPGGCLSMAKALKDKFLMASGLDEILDLSHIEKYIVNGISEED
ncbi:hypothetical protein KSS87_006626 [Heliosperma pusillum]|nr:hypothetical protein KSS87_006626 [Heliosperma pusillum]